MRHQATYRGVRLCAALWLGMTLLTACGAGSQTGTASDAPGPPRTPSAAAIASVTRPSNPIQAAITLTNADDGKTVQVKVGQSIHVALKAPDGYKNWEVGVAANVAVLVPAVNPAATAVRGATLAAFKAVGPGQTDVTATSRVDCPPGQACPLIVRAYRVTVVVRE